MNSLDLGFQLAIFQATTLAVAAFGKSVAPQAGRWALLPLSEAGLAIALIVTALTEIGPATLGVRVVALGLFAAYFAYSFIRQPSERCACFGDLLPQAGKRWLVWRNTVYVLSALASIPLVSSLLPPWWLLDATLGGLAAVAFAAAPAARDWIFDAH